MEKTRSSGRIVEYWENERLPSMHKTSEGFRISLLQRANAETLSHLFETPFLPLEEIEKRQLSRIRELVRLVYTKILFYREKYQAAGIRLEDLELKSWEDYHSLPCVTKEELIEAFPNRCVNPDYEITDLFPTRSSGSSGKTLRILVDPEAIITDTLQGIRQFWLQSEGKYSEEDIIAHVYTVPWWIDSLEGRYQSVFISSLIKPEEIAEILNNEVKPDILSLYPTNLRSIIPFLSEEMKRKLRLVVVHSEMSSRTERDEMSKLLNVSVLDEYSSEELTRIALELTCGHYHLCEDTVRVDIVDPTTLKPITRGTGLVVGTNLLNRAMPFIRYIQGDFASIKEPRDCRIQWRQIEKVEGRANDAFVGKDGVLIPAGTLLDITYRWMFDTGINIQEFELIQASPTDIKVRIFEPTLLQDYDSMNNSLDYLKALLNPFLSEETNFIFEILEQPFPKSQKKRRPIRREF